VTRLPGGADQSSAAAATSIGEQMLPAAVPPAVVDIHAHVVPPALVAELAAGRLRFPHVEVRQQGSGHVLSFNGGPPTRPMAAGLTDAGRRAAWLAEQGIACQVVGGWLDIFGYELPADEGADWAVALTEAIAELAAAAARLPAGPRLIALGTVPLQDPGRAAAALHEGPVAHTPGVMIATRAGGRELDDPALTPFWEAAHAAGAVVFLHPGFAGATARYADFGLANGLARVEDSTVTLARLLYAGVPARYPNMKLIVAHGGGALPYVLGRLIRNHVIDPGGTADPLESFACLYFDSVVFDPAALELLVAKAGADHVLLGSDYPFPIGDPAPRAVVERAALPDRGLGQIFGGNAVRLLGQLAVAPACAGAADSGTGRAGAADTGAADTGAPVIPPAGKGTQ
jgi:aminocarboxymuconate-semialdehyde decarboxylase